MSDEASVLTMLAKRGATKTAPKETPDVSGAMLLQLAECRKECEAHKAAALSMADAYNRKCEEHQRAMDAKLGEIATLTQECANNKARYTALEQRAPEVRYQENASDESLRATNADLMVKCGTLEGRCAELERTVAILRERPIETERESPEAEHAEPTPTNYDIDVVRGGDDRIRSLRVRASNT